MISEAAKPLNNTSWYVLPKEANEEAVGEKTIKLYHIYFKSNSGPVMISTSNLFLVVMIYFDKEICKYFIWLTEKPFKKVRAMLVLGFISWDKYAPLVFLFPLSEPITVLTDPKAISGLLESIKKIFKLFQVLIYFLKIILQNFFVVSDTLI